MISRKDELISTMIVKCGINPESLIRKVEEGLEREIKYELGGLYISRQGNIISAGVRHPSILDKTVWYQWRV